MNPMKHIILDYFRRWWWVMLGSGIVSFLCVRTVNAFFVFGVTLLGGANLMTMDIARGFKHAAATWPLTRRQTGMALWIAIVPATTAVFALAIVAGWGVHFIRNTSAMPSPTYWLAIIALLPCWQANHFVLALVHHYSPPSKSSHWRGVWMPLLASATLLVNMLLSAKIDRHPGFFYALLGLGCMSLAFSWHIARNLDLSRTPTTWATTFFHPSSKSRPRDIGGSGGPAFLFRTLVLRSIGCWMGFTILIVLVWMFMKHIKSLQQMDVLYLSLLLPVSILSVAILPLDWHLKRLRHLRSMPLSTNALTLLLIAIVLTPVFTAAVVQIALAAWLVPSPMAMNLVKLYAADFPILTLYLWIVVWQGTRLRSYAMTFLLLIATYIGTMFMVLSDRIDDLSPGVLSLWCLGLGLVFLGLVRHSLAARGESYRSHAFDNWLVGGD
jgi:hypothetical protein